MPRPLSKNCTITPVETRIPGGKRGVTTAYHNGRKKRVEEERTIRFGNEICILHDSRSRLILRWIEYRGEYYNGKFTHDDPSHSSRRWNYKFAYKFFSNSPSLWCTTLCTTSSKLESKLHCSNSCLSKGRSFRWRHERSELRKRGEGTCSRRALNIIFVVLSDEEMAFRNEDYIKASPDTFLSDRSAQPRSSSHEEG